MQREAGPQELAEHVDRRAARPARELLAVLLGPEDGARLLQARLQLGVALDAVAHHADQLRGLPAPRRLGRLVAGGGDVVQDRRLRAVAALDVRERLVEQRGHGGEPVDRAHVATGGVELLPQRLGVLDGAVAGLLGGQPGVAEQAAADQVLELHLGRDLRGLDVRVERADQHVDRLVGRAQVHLAVRARQLDEQLEVETPPHVAAVGGERAVLDGEPAVEAADVDQVLDHPPADPLVLTGRGVRRLRADEGQQPTHHFGLGGAVVEVHGEGDLVDGLEADLGHLVALGVDPVQPGLAGVEVVQRGCAGERLQATGEPLVARTRHTRLHAAHSTRTLRRARRPPGGRGRTSTPGTLPRCGPGASSRTPRPGRGPVRARRTGTAAADA